MNYIDAHRIVNTFTFAFANKLSPFTFGLYPISFLDGINEQTFKTDIVNAIKIYIAHGMFWSTLSQEKIESILLLTLNIDGFVNDEKAYAVLDAANVLERAAKSVIFSLLNKEKINISTQLYQDALSTVHSTKYYDELADYYNELVSLVEEYHRINNEAMEGKNNLRLGEIVFRYAYEAYNLAHMQYEQDYDVFFYPVATLKKWCNHPNFMTLLAPYKNYICALQSEERYKNIK